MTVLALIVVFVALTVFSLFIIACLHTGYKAYRHFIMPSIVYKRRYGKFVEDDA